MSTILLIYILIGLINCLFSIDFNENIEGAYYYDEIIIAVILCTIFWPLFEGINLYFIIKNFIRIKKFKRRIKF